MSRRRKIGIGVAAAYILAIIVVVLIFGAKRQDNKEFQPQREFKLDTWVNLPGPFDINKGVLYVVLAAALTVITMVFISRRHSGSGLSFTNTSKLLGSVGSVPSSGRPSWLMRDSTCGKRSMIELSTGSMRRPSFSAVLEGSVNVR